MSEFAFSRSDSDYSDFLAHLLSLSLTHMSHISVAIDTDGNGTLDAEESARGLMTLMPIERCQVDALVKKFDTDGDGVISFAEFVAMARCLHDIRSNVHALHTSSDELPSGTRAGAAAKSGLAPAATGLLLSKEVELLDGPYRKIRRTPLSKALEADPWEKRFLVFTGHWVVVYRSVSCFSRGDAPLIALSSLEIDAMKLVGASLKKLQLTTSNSHGTLTISYRSPTDAKQWMWEISHHQYRLVATMDHKIEAARQAGFDDEKVRKYATGRYATGRGDGGDLILVGLIVGEQKMAGLSLCLSTHTHSPVLSFFLSFSLFSCALYVSGGSVRSRSSRNSRPRLP